MASSPVKRPSALFEMVKGRLREFLREPSAFFFVIFMPLLWMAILGNAFSGARHEVYGVGWPKSSDEMGPVQIVHAVLSTNDQVRLLVGTPEELNTALLRGQILLQVNPQAGSEAWSYAFDPANREATRARGAIDDIVQTALGRRDALPIQDKQITVPGSRYIDFLVPGLVALSIMTSSLFGVGAVIVVSRRENLFKRFLVTPMSPTSYIVSHVIGRMLVLLIEVGAILLGGWLFFGFKMHGSPFAFAAVAMLGAATFTALAVLCGSRTSNMAVMNGFTNLISLPMMIVAGIWFARDNFPPWMAHAARYLPLTALVDGLRRIALEGATLAALGPELAVSAGYFVVCAVGARVLFKWY